MSIYVEPLKRREKHLSFYSTFAISLQQNILTLLKPYDIIKMIQSSKNKEIEQIFDSLAPVKMP